MEPSQPQTKTGKEQYGCMALLIRLGIILIILFVIDYVVTLIFNKSYPHDVTTNALIPFQNNYLAQTDAFVTSEGATTEFGIDPGIVVRFIAISFLPVACYVILNIFLFIIPFTKKFLDYFWYGFALVLLATMSIAMFIPPVMTVFDRDRKVMTVHQSDWGFIITKKEIPFDQISGFTSKVHDISGFDHYDDAKYIDLFATTTNGEIFIADSQVNIPVTKTEQQGVDAAILALNLLIGKNPMAPPADLLQNGE